MTVFPVSRQLTGVIPAKAGIHLSFRSSGKMDSRLRGNDTVDVLTRQNSRHTQ